MTYTVELRYIGGDLADLIRDMRAWLHRNRINPEELHHSSSPPGLAFRVAFSDRDQARRFAEAFRGWLECADPQGAGGRWTAALSPQKTRREWMSTAKPAHPRV
jgi:hypothetical protein